MPVSSAQFVLVERVKVFSVKGSSLQSFPIVGFSVSLSFRHSFKYVRTCSLLLDRARGRRASGPFSEGLLYVSVGVEKGAKVRRLNGCI